jgi:hypothetical protein
MPPKHDPADAVSDWLQNGRGRDPTQLAVCRVQASPRAWISEIKRATSRSDASSPSRTSGSKRTLVNGAHVVEGHEPDYEAAQHVDRLQACASMRRRLCNRAGERRVAQGVCRSEEIKCTQGQCEIANAQPRLQA